MTVLRTPDIQDRRVEITGPTDRKMIINALNSGAKVFMADCEDSMTPTWDNVVRGQINVRDAYRRELALRMGAHLAVDPRHLGASQAQGQCPGERGTWLACRPSLPPELSRVARGERCGSRRKWTRA